MPPQRKARPRKAFVIAPFPVESKAIIKNKKLLYEKARKLGARAAGIKHGRAGFAEVLQALEVARKRRYGLVVDVERIVALASAPSEVGMFFQTLFGFYRAQNPNTIRAAHLESIQIIKQLRRLGFGVKIQDSRDRGRKVFVRAAQRAGATKTRPYNELLPEELIPKLGMSWARDQWIKIGGKREMPRTDMGSMLFGPSHFFGEGGSMIQVGPKEFAVAEGLSTDPRIGAYERKGYRFQFMPFGTVFDKTLSDLFGTKIYTVAPHIDFSIGGIPEKRISAVDPHYYSDHRGSVELMQQNLKTKVVFVPEKEADRHPACFLPLGQGRVLVDRGAPGFIQQLKKAGAKVIPTAVPLDALLDLKGGLHCLFNEH